MMIGIVVSNSILVVDFANALMQNGVPVQEAVVMAGRLRLRPVLMTALATCLGLLPMAVGFGEGAETNVPPARAVIGGGARSCAGALRGGAVSSRVGAPPARGAGPPWG